jgi:hypothetical protein
MTDYTFKPSLTNDEPDWSDPTVWEGGVVPDSSDADVNFPTVTVPSDGETYTSNVIIGNNETFSVQSVSLRDSLSIYGSLVVSGALTQYPDGEIDLHGGTLDVGSITNDAEFQGFGQIDVATLTNDTVLSGYSGYDLTLNATSLVNNGVIDASGDEITVNVPDGGFSGLVNGTLGLGALQADYNGGIVLNVGQVLTSDAAAIALNGGDIFSLDSATGQYVPLENSLSTIATAGSLTIGASAAYDFSALDVKGSLLLTSGNVGAQTLTIDSGGQLAGHGDVTSAVENDGVIRAGMGGSTDIGGTLVLSGAVTGSGRLEVGPSGPAGSVLEIADPTSQNVIFDGVGTLVLDQPSTFTGAIGTVGTADAINLAGVALGSITNVSYIGNSKGGTLSLQQAGGALTFQFLGSHALGDFDITAGPQALSSDPQSTDVTVTGGGLPSSATPPTLDGFSVSVGSEDGQPTVQFNTSVTEANSGVASVEVQLSRAIDLDGATAQTAGLGDPPTYTPTSTSVSSLELTGPPALDVTGEGGGAETWLSPEHNFLFNQGDYLLPNQLVPEYITTAPLQADDYGYYGIDAVTVTGTDGGTVTYDTAELQAMGVGTSFEVTDAGALGALESFTGAGQTLTAPLTGQAYYVADGSGDTVQLNGNVKDYTLSRVQPEDVSGATPDQVGAFLLTANNGSGAYAIEQGVTGVRFQDGQYLSLKDLPYYVQGDPSLQMGGDDNNFLYQNISEPYELFIGGAGQDEVCLTGNTSDYTLKPFAAVTPVEPDGEGGQTYSGLELVANNGSGDLLIDSSVETVLFQDGQYLSYKDLQDYIPANTSQAATTFDIGLDGDFDQPLDYQGTSGNNTALLNGNVGDYTLSRDAAGDFVLDEHYQTNGVEDTLTLGEDVTTVQFRDGQYLSPQDLQYYIAGDPSFTDGTAGDDILTTPLGGDQYVFGGAGDDNLFLHGNVYDYTLAPVDIPAQNGQPAIDGYELIAKNGSGNIYIDQSVDTTHFQDGQYLAFKDLVDYIAPANAFSLPGNDTISLGSGQDTVSALGSATVYGGSGGSSIAGGAGGLTYYGSSSTAERDTVSGGAGPNQFYSGAGQDTLISGTAAGASDLFVFTAGTAGGGSHLIPTFGGADTISLAGYAPSEVQTSYSGGSTFIKLADGTTLTVGATLTEHLANGQVTFTS